MTDSRSDRRRFFARLVDDIPRLLRDVSEVLQEGVEVLQEGVVGASADEASALAEPPPVPVLVQLPAVVHTASVDELLILVDEEGLQHRHEALADLARSSIRISPAGEGDAVGARLGGPPEPDGSERTWRCLAQIDLADPVLAGSGLPSTGRLRIEVKTAREVVEIESECTEARVTFEPGTLEDPGGIAGRLSAELILPRVWSASVQRLELDESLFEGG